HRGGVAAHAVRVEEAVRGAGAGGAGREAAGSAEGEPGAGSDAACDPDAEGGARRVGVRADPRHADALGGGRGERGSGGAGAAGGGLRERGAADGAARGQAAGVRAIKAEPAVAVGPVHVPVEAGGAAAVPGGVPGRSQPVYGGCRALRVVVGGFGAGGVRGGHRELRGAGGSADGPGTAVPHVARDERVRAAVRAARDKAGGGAGAAPADAGEDRAVLGDAVAGGGGAGGARGTGGG